MCMLLTLPSICLARTAWATPQVAPTPPTSPILQRGLLVSPHHGPSLKGRPFLPLLLPPLWKLPERRPLASWCWPFPGALPLSSPCSSPPLSLARARSLNLPTVPHSTSDSWVYFWLNLSWATPQSASAFYCATDRSLSSCCLSFPFFHKSWDNRNSQSQ